MRSIMIARTLVCILCVIAAGFPLFSQIDEWESLLAKNPRHVELLLNLGRGYYNIGGPGEDRDAVRKADAYLERLMEIEPGHALGLVYSGSVQTMKTRYILLPWNKLKLVKRGLARMDRAVSLDSSDPEIRFIRGCVSASLPGMFDRMETALEDFSMVEKALRNDTDALSRDLQPAYYYNHGLALMRSGRTVEAGIKFDLVIKADPQSDYAGYAERELNQIQARAAASEDHRMNQEYEDG